MSRTEPPDANAPCPALPIAPEQAVVAVSLPPHCAEKDSSARPTDPCARLTPRVVAALVMINLLWGASSVAAKASLERIGPITLAFLRFLPAGLVLLALCRKTGRILPIATGDRPRLVLLALVGIALTYSIFYTGVGQTSATDSSLLFGCEPILIALFAGLFLRERLGGVQWAGMLIGLLGIYKIAGSAWGNIVALCALVIETSTCVIGKRLAGKYPGLLVSAYEMLIGVTLLLPFAVVESLRHPPVFTPAALGSLAYLSLICSALGYGMWYHLLERYPVSSLGIFILLQPLSGPIFGVLFRHESLTAASALGGLLILAGVALTTLTRRGKPIESLASR